MSSKRIEWLDVVKYVCIMFVMMHHLESTTEYLSGFLVPFALPGFFFVSGYVSRKGESFKTHLLKKAKGLLWPWFLFSNINILLSLAMSLKGHRDFKEMILKNLIQVRGFGDGAWFLAALFVAFIPFYFVIKWDKPRVTIPVIFILSVASHIYSILLPKTVFPWGSAALPWHLEDVFIYLLWMVLGYYFKESIESRLDSINSIPNRIVVFFGYIGIVSIPILMHFNTATKCFYEYFESVIGLALIIMIAKTIKTNKYISFVGANTLLYFVLHGKTIAIVEKILSTKLSGFYQFCLSNSFTSSLMAIVITIVISFILIIPAYLINRYLPWMIGKKRVKRSN